MNSQEYRNLQEAYLDVYQELDELHRGRHGQTETEYMDSRSDAGKQISGDSKSSGAAYSHRSYKGVGKPAKPGERQETQGKMDRGTKIDIEYRKAARLKKEELSLDERVLGQDPEMRRARTKDEKRLPPSSGKEYAANQKKSISYMDKLTKNNKIIPGMAHEEVEEFDEATAMAKRGYDEAFKPLPTEKLDNKIKKLAVSSDSDSGRRQGNIGRVRSNIGKSQKTQSFGSTESQKRKSAKHHAKSYLRQNRHSTQDTKDKPDLYTRAVGYYIDRGEDAKKKHLQRMNKESYDLYDIILSHLITEGYADTNENALVIMANMSEEWKNSIIG